MSALVAFALGLLIGGVGGVVIMVALTFRAAIKEFSLDFDEKMI